jgi:hypothetical protein
MAFTSTEEAGLKAILTAFATGGFTTQAQLTYAMTRLKLEQDLRKLESQETNLRNQYEAGTSTFNDALVAVQAAQAAKQAEIDALP